MFQDFVPSKINADNPLALDPILLDLQNESRKMEFSKRKKEYASTSKRVEKSKFDVKPHKRTLEPCMKKNNHTLLCKTLSVEKQTISLAGKDKQIHGEDALTRTGRRQSNFWF